MIHHVSLSATDPQRVAYALAQLLGGKALPWPPVAQGSWVAVAGDECGTTVEIYPQGIELQPAAGDADAFGVVNPAASPWTATHVAITTALSDEQVHGLARTNGWTAKYRKRGGQFGVIELWLENHVLIEVMTTSMQAEYLGFMANGVEAFCRSAGDHGPAAPA